MEFFFFLVLLPKSNFTMAIFPQRIKDFRKKNYAKIFANLMKFFLRKKICRPLTAHQCVKRNTTKTREEKIFVENGKRRLELIQPFCGDHLKAERSEKWCWKFFWQKNFHEKREIREKSEIFRNFRRFLTFSCQKICQTLFFAKFRSELLKNLVKFLRFSILVTDFTICVIKFCTNIVKKICKTVNNS